MKRLRCLLLAALIAVLPAAGQNASFRLDEFHGRRAFVLENGRMRLSALPGGGHIAEVRLKSPDPKKSVNPMRVPHYQTIDPHTYDPARHGALYGTASNRLVQAGYMGHFLCFPHYGPPSEGEIRHGLGNHGEALTVEWKQLEADGRDDVVFLHYGAVLPKTQCRVERTIVIPADETVAYVEEQVENLALFDRPVNWVQHVTFGAPFVAQGRNFVDAPVVDVAFRASRDGSEGQEPDIDWPWAALPNGERIDLRQFTTSPRSGAYRAWLLDRSRPRGYFTVYNPEYRVLIGYLFDTAYNPWIGDWQENRKNTTPPWNGKAVARGLELGTTPFGGRKGSIELGSLYGAPTYCWLGARERLQQSYVIFLAEIPSGFRGVADVRTDGERILIEERESGKTISIKSARDW